MESSAYVMIEAESVADLQEKCNTLMKAEEMEGDVMYVYEPLGAPLLDKDMHGFPLFYQAFQLQMLMPMGEMPVDAEQRLDS